MPAAQPLIDVEKVVIRHRHPSVLDPFREQRMNSFLFPLTCTVLDHRDQGSNEAKRRRGREDGKRQEGCNEESFAEGCGRESAGVLEFSIR